MTDLLPLNPGISIGGHYIIGALISRGGFGAVYRGIDTGGGNWACAIKETYDVTPAARRQALMEAAILFTIRSRHLPQVFDAFEANGRFYLVMQFIEGQTLLQLVKQRGAPCSEQEVLPWLLPVMYVLQELHSRNPAVMHRDIKPGNIILTPDHTAVLVDFGLTKLYDPDSDTQTMVRAVSEGFSPVEQYIGKTSPQSDIYALAATIYFLLTLRTPPTAISRSVRDELIAPRALNPALSPNIERVLLKALSMDTDQRYRSMDEFAQALQNPGFTAYADPTIASYSNRLGPAYTPTERAQVQSQPSSAGGRSILRPAPAQVVPARRPSNPPLYPLLPANPLAIPQSPARVTQNLQPLPSPFSQGCLWGLLQGVLSALLVIAMKKEVYFYVAVVEGLLFYLVAGFFTTRKGGRSSRGAWAGFWAGVVSTLVFWIVLAAGIVTQLMQRIRIDAARLQSPGALSHALLAVVPAFLNHPATQATGTSLTIFLVSGLLCAIGFGWLGGTLGTLRYRAKIQRKSYP
jgi:serine/threonine protein kinase